LKELTVVSGKRSYVVPSPLKSPPSTKALNGGALAYEKLNPSRKPYGSRATPARFTMYVMSFVSGPRLLSQSSRLKPSPVLVPVLLK